MKSTTVWCDMKRSRYNKSMFSSFGNSIFICSFDSDEQNRDGSAVPCKCGDDPMASALWYSVVTCSLHTQGKTGMSLTGIPVSQSKKTIHQNHRITWQVPHDTQYEYHGACEIAHFSLTLCPETIQPDCWSSPAVDLPTSCCKTFQTEYSIKDSINLIGSRSVVDRHLRYLYLIGGSIYVLEGTNNRAEFQNSGQLANQFNRIHSPSSVLPQGSRLDMSGEFRSSITTGISTHRLIACEVFNECI